MTNCQFCGKEIHFDPNIKSKRGKYIPLSGKTRTSKHRCSARPFNKQTRRQWWSQEGQRQQHQRRQQQKQETTRVVPERIEKYFVLLSLSSLCRSAYEVKRAYRKLALLHHPDRSNDPSITGKFIEVQEAYEKCLQELSQANAEG